MAIKLKAARVNAELTQADAAKKLRISKSTLNNYEKYTNSPNVAMAKQIAKLYGMNIDDIIWNE